jgi:transposase
MAIIGIDVSKAKLDCLWLRDSISLKVKSKVFSNTPAGQHALLDWAVKQTGKAIKELHYVMEATGIYHEGVAYTKHEAGDRVSVVNPAQLRDYAKSLGTRTKTDKKDALVIVYFGATQQPWQPEPAEVRQLEALIARLEAVKQDIQRELNRLEKTQISQTSEDVVHSIEMVHRQLNEEKTRLEALIDERIDQHPGLKQDRTLLESIPGVGSVISQQMVAFLRSRAFENAAQGAAFLGLVPGKHESGSSVRGRSHLSKAGNAHLSAKLYIAAIVAKRYNPDIRCQYKGLIKRGKTGKSALCTAMRKLVQICFGVLKHQASYLPQAV